MSGNEGVGPDISRPDADAAYADLLRRAGLDENVLGVVLFGSRGFDAFVTARSDFDVMVVVDREPKPWRTPHGSPVEVWPMDLAEFRDHAMPGSADAWNRPTFLGATVVLDKIDGEIRRIVARKHSLGAGEAAELAAKSLDDYVNSLFRSLRSLEAGRDLEGRLDALESVSPLLTTAFALEGRVRPFNKWLRHELAARPLGIPRLVDLVDAIAATPTVDLQRTMFRLMELAARAAGHGRVIDAWEPDVAWLRGD